MDYNTCVDFDIVDYCTNRVFVEKIKRKINAHGFGISIGLLARCVLILMRDFNDFMGIIVQYNRTHYNISENSE